MYAFDLDCCRFVLAISSSASPASVGIYDSRGRRLWTYVEASLKTGEGLLGALAKAIHSQAFDVDAMIVDCGPGQFTGLRAGIGLAQGLGLGWNIPVLPVDSASMMAWSAKRLFRTSSSGARSQSDCFKILTVKDARLGAFYVGAFDSVDALISARTPAVRELKFEPLMELIASQEGFDDPLFIVSDDSSMSRIAQSQQFRLADSQLADSSLHLCALPGPAELLDALVELGLERLGFHFSHQDWEIAATALPSALLSAERLQPYYVRHEVALDLSAQRALRRAQSHAT